MAAPKKCKSLMKRRIAHGDKMKSPKARAFNGLSIKINNISRCSVCNRIVRSHVYCYVCNVNQIRETV